MTKTKSRARRMLSLLISLAMALMLLVPAMASAAEEPAYTITILPNGNTLTPEGVSGTEKTTLEERFNAYEIFKGTLGDFTGSTSGTPNAGQLSDVAWGSGVKDTSYSELLAALVKSAETITNLGVSTTADSVTKYNDATNPSSFTVDNTTTLGAIFKRALEMKGYSVSDATVTAGTSGEATLENSAAVIAEVISDLNKATASENNTTLANEFAKILATKNDTGYSFLSDTKTESTWTAPTAGNADDKGKWTIGLAEAGYYLVVDTYNAGNPATGTTEEDEISKYMLAVYGDQTINIKSNAATVEKDIVKADNTTTKGDSAEIGGTVKFRLTGTLPENYASYTTFKYAFHDTPSDGLTFDASSVKVYAVKPGASSEADTKYEIAQDSNPGVPTGDGYTLTSNTPAAGKLGGGSFDVNFSNLKNVKGTKVVEPSTDPAPRSEDLEITKDWTIIVEYTATVNADAVVVNPDANPTDDGDRNYNKVTLEYSNDVNDNGTGGSTAKTPEKTVYVYVYGENVNKVDGTTDEALAGAGFALTKEVGTTPETYYAVFTKASRVAADQTVDEYVGNVEVTTYEYTLAGWIAASEFEAGGVLADFPSSGKNWINEAVKGTTLNSAAKKIGTFDTTATTDYYLAFATVKTDVYDADDTGSSPKYKQEVLFVKGIEDGTYTLKEVVTPLGYETMKDVTFQITERINQTTGDLESVGASLLNGDTRQDAHFTAASAETPGYIPVTLENMPSGYLPGTGGMGTVLFYTGGVVMLVLGVLHILRRRRLAD